MDGEVSEQALGSKKRCDKDSACLKCDGENVCAAEYCVGKDVLFVKCPAGLQCPYRGSFGGGHYCTCPTRLELYKKRGI